MAIVLKRGDDGGLLCVQMVRLRMRLPCRLDVMEYCSVCEWCGCECDRLVDLTCLRMQVVYSESTTSNHVTIGNPAPVLLNDSKTILLPFCRNNQHLLMINRSECTRACVKTGKHTTAHSHAAARTAVPPGPRCAISPTASSTRAGLQQVATTSLLSPVSLQ